MAIAQAITPERLREMMWDIVMRGQIITQGRSRETHICMYQIKGDEATNMWGHRIVYADFFPAFQMSRVSSVVVESLGRAEVSLLASEIERWHDIFRRDAAFVALEQVDGIGPQEIPITTTDFRVHFFAMRAALARIIVAEKDGPAYQHMTRALVRLEQFLENGR